jgi:hypothetical protein
MHYTNGALDYRNRSSIVLKLAKKKNRNVAKVA